MGVAALFQRFEMNIVETIETADPQRVVIRYDGDCLSKDGSVSYCNSYIGSFTVVGGQIAQILEYANPLVAGRMFEQLSANRARLRPRS
jgi:ketosteroid isomerase-like protein